MPLLNYAKVLLAIATLANPICAQDDQPPGTETFLTRPGQYAVKLKVKVNKAPHKLGEGYIFATPFGETATTRDLGLHIYDNHGDVVFFGPQLQNARTIDAHVCNYAGKNTLCFTDAFPGPSPGHSTGVDRFFNHHYEQVGPDYTRLGNLTRPDGHELNTAASLHGKGFINDVFQSLPYDLSHYDGPKDGWIISGCFQQRSFENKLQFQWCSDAHVPFYETYSYVAGNSAGNRSNSKNHGTKQYPWDYFHINSIDRDNNGDYYVSSRQCFTIYKVAGANSKYPGRIIWRLGGRYSDFKTKGKDFRFLSQHTIRVARQDPKTTLLYLFDNHFPKPKHGARGSSGKYIHLNTKKMTAELVQEYHQPDGRYSSTGGQLQPLDNGNVFIGWGSDPSFSEYLRGNPGKLLWYVTFNNAYKSYRTWKFPWVGEPKTSPDTFAYQHRCNSKGMSVYMSWNGATEYTGWKVYGHNKNATKGGEQLGETFQRTGYETRAHIKAGKKFYRYVYAEAMGNKGQVLATTNAQAMFVPTHKLAKTCSEHRCPEGTSYGSHQSRAQKC